MEVNLIPLQEEMTNTSELYQQVLR